jgi:hypothetical protein
MGNHLISRQMTSGYRTLFRPEYRTSFSDFQMVKTRWQSKKVPTIRKLTKMILISDHGLKATI